MVGLQRKAEGGAWRAQQESQRGSGAGSGISLLIDTAPLVHLSHNLPHNFRPNFGFLRQHLGRWLKNPNLGNLTGRIWKSDGNVSARVSVRLKKGR